MIETSQLDKYSMLTMLTDDLQELQNRHNALMREHNNQAATVAHLKEQLEAANAKSNQLEYRLSATKEEQDLQMGKLTALRCTMTEMIKG